LDIIHQKDVLIAILGSKLSHFFVPQAVDQFVGKFLRRKVTDLGREIILDNVISNGVKEVSLSETNASVDEQGVVVFSREVGYGQGGGMSELIARPNDEGLKGIARVEPILLHRLFDGSRIFVDGLWFYFFFLYPFL
jgi:hypothetical protein